MGMVHVPNILEKSLVEHFKSSLSTSYNIYRGFSASEYSTPCVIVAAGRTTELEPHVNVFAVQVAVMVLTTIDEDSEPLESHDETTQAVYDLLRDDLTPAVGTTGQLHLAGHFLESMEQGREERLLTTALNYTFHVERLPLA